MSPPSRESHRPLGIAVPRRASLRLPHDLLFDVSRDSLRHSLLSTRATTNPMDQSSGLVHKSSESRAKIALFRSLFRGREDIYPRRFESRKTGRSGYQPACGNEWVRGVCEKPRIKCSDCPNQCFLEVTDEVVRWHLSGKDAQSSDF